MAPSTYSMTLSCMIETVYNRTMPKRDPEAQRAYNRAYYAAHREHLIAEAKAWNEAHPEARKAGQKKWYESKGREQRAGRRDEYNAYQRAYDAAHPEKVSADNRTQRLRRYGLTVVAYEEMLAAQNGLCALCGKVETHRDKRGEITRLAVDHDHVTGSVRALLCHACNTGVGSFYDDPAVLRAAAEYIERFRR